MVELFWGSQMLSLNFSNVRNVCNWMCFYFAPWTCIALSPALPCDCSLPCSLPLFPLGNIPSCLQTDSRAPQSPSPTTHIHPLHQPNPLKDPSWTLHSPPRPVKPPPELTTCSKRCLGVFSASRDLLALNQSELPWEQRGCCTSFIFLRLEGFFFSFSNHCLCRE